MQQSKDHILNLLVHEHVMEREPGVAVKPYASERESAMQVWEKVESIGGDSYEIFIKNLPSYTSGSKLQVPSKEICLAALKAVGVEDTPPTNPDL